MTEGTIVFAGGGVAGIAWELGVVAGIGDADPGLLEQLLAPGVRFVGTSAGSAVAAQLASGADLDGLVAAQQSAETAEFAPDIDIAAVLALLGGAQAGEATDAPTDPAARRREMGRAALAAPTVPQERRLATIRARLPRPEWSERPVLITAVDTDTGDLRVFDRSSGVPLDLAVTASCAVPGVWPPVEIDGRRYMDGGVSSVANAQLAAGSPWVLVIAPIPEGGGGFGSIGTEELATLGDARVLVLYADEASIAAFGPNALDPASRPGAVAAGQAVGRTVAADVAALIS
jgi:NTE family protein